MVYSWLCMLNGIMTLFHTIFLKESLPGCKGIWTVYHKNLRNDISKGAADEDEYHAYLIISLENRTMVCH